EIAQRALAASWCLPDGRGSMSRQKTRLRFPSRLFAERCSTRSPRSAGAVSTARHAAPLRPRSISRRAQESRLRAHIRTRDWVAPSEAFSPPPALLLRVPIALGHARAPPTLAVIRARPQ